MRTTRLELIAVVFLGAQALGAIGGTASGWYGNTLLFRGASGSDGWQLTTNGLQAHFGTGANDWCTSNGTNITCSDAGFDINAPAHLSGYYDGAIIGANTNIAESRFATIVRGTRLTYTVTNAGADGAHTFDIDVFDATSSTVLCSKTGIACNVAAGPTSTSCTAASNAALDDIRLRVSDANCVTVGKGNLVWEYR